MKITLELDTDRDAAFLKAIGLDFSGSPTATPAAAKGKAKESPPAAVAAPAAPPAASPPPAAPSEPAAAPAAPASAPAGVDETLLPEIRKAMSSLGGLLEPKAAVAFMREMGYQSAASIPPEKRPEVLSKLQTKIDEIVTG